jgi:hypothetical protein
MPNGEIRFTTHIDQITHGRLRARSAIAPFYREPGVIAGDSVKWEKVDSTTYRSTRFNWTTRIIERVRVPSFPPKWAICVSLGTKHL